MSDGSLVQRARAGGAAAATELFERHWLSAWRIALAVTGDRSAADDVAQMALIRAFANLRSFDVARPFAPWLNRIVTRSAIDHLRTKPSWMVHGDELPDREGGWEEPGDIKERVDVAVLALEHDRRMVVVLRYWGDMGVDEIASLLELPPGTVASRLSRGLADLRTTIEEGSHARPEL